MNLGRKTALLMVHNDNAALGHRRDVRGAAAARQAGSFSVLFDPVRIQIAEAIDLRAADKAEVDPIGLQQAHDVVQAAATEGASDIRRIAHRKYRYQRRPITDHAVFKDSKGVRSVEFLGNGEP